MRKQRRNDALGGCQDYFLREKLNVFDLNALSRAPDPSVRARSCLRSRDEHDEEHEERDEHAEDLHDQPPVGGDGVEVLEHLRLRVVDVGDGALDVFVDPDRHLALLRDHRRELLKDAPELRDRLLDVLQRLRPRRQVLVLRVRHQKLRRLLPAAEVRRPAGVPRRARRSPEPIRSPEPPRGVPSGAG